MDRLAQIREWDDRHEFNRFWSKRVEWSFEPRGYVFLARAINQIGAESYGQTWPSDESKVAFDPMFSEVVLSLRRHCADGDLESAILRSDGQLEAVPAHAWNTDGFKRWIINCTAPATIIPRSHWHPVDFRRELTRD